MDPLAIALEFLSAIPSLIAAGQDIVSLTTQAASVVQTAQAAHADPTNADWDALNAELQALRAAISKA